MGSVVSKVEWFSDGVVGSGQGIHHGGTETRSRRAAGLEQEITKGTEDDETEIDLNTTAGRSRQAAEV